jgi:hypothetical protein
LIISDARMVGFFSAKSRTICEVLEEFFVPFFKMGLLKSNKLSEKARV